MRVETITGKRRIVRAEGEIDLYNVGLLVAELQEGVKQSPEGFVIDFTRTTYLDSAGVQAIVSAFRRLHEVNGRLALVVGNENIRALLHLLRLDQLPGVFICEDMTSAENAIAGIT